MKHLSDWKGRVVWHEDGEKNADGSPKFYYLDDDTPIDHDNPLPCPFCGREFDPDNPVDPCLGRIPGIKNACCGHGAFDRYFQHESGIVTRQNDHLWWQHATFPGMDSILNDRRIDDVRGSWIRLYSNVNEDVWINVFPIATIPWRESIPRLTYPYGMDNLTRLLDEIYRAINEHYIIIHDEESYAEIKLLDRKNAILASELMSVYYDQIEPMSRAFRMKEKHGIDGAWIYDEQFILPKTEFMRLTTHAPMIFMNSRIRCELPQNAHDVYIVLRSSNVDPTVFDTVLDLFRVQFSTNDDRVEPWPLL